MLLYFNINDLGMTRVKEAAHSSSIILRYIIQPKHTVPLVDTPTTKMSVLLTASKKSVKCKSAKKPKKIVRTIHHQKLPAQQSK